MLGWFSTPAARASFWKRRTISCASSPWTSSRIVLSATVRPIVGSSALYTTPMAPRPSSPVISYLPTVCRDIMRALFLQLSGALACLGGETYQFTDTSSGGHTLRVNRKYPILLLPVNARPRWICDFSLLTPSRINTLITLPSPPYNAFYAPSPDCLTASALLPFRAGWKQEPAATISSRCPPGRDTRRPARRSGTGNQARIGLPD